MQSLNELPFFEHKFLISFQKAGKKYSLLHNYQHHIYSMQYTIPSAVDGKTQFTNLVWQILAEEL